MTGFLIPTWVTERKTKWGLGLQQLIDMPAENIYNFG
ncbi:predicted protein [Plenodomus lingam JN3]|uniref:Predicted protein n=1 Tax=Leptosphaeria maculans (strain JN3 / isolate v23.1.3 / race Av1-4-5-6-7-8) TaxID=985895 RepID=E4ZYI2_LEPMJ|nr:predicted protein [Plenodomus lingam JN3]CBX96508.1 predicted protein [Plenodomus lingam JN3]